MPADRAITCDAVRAICEADGKSYAVLVAIDRAAGTTQFTTWGMTPEDKVEAKGLADYMASDLCPVDPSKPQEVYESFVLDAAKNKAEAERLAGELARLTAGVVFTDEQCFALNAGQHDHRQHGYTCGTDSGHRPLIATRQGWRCADCDYRQTWAHGIPPR